MSKSLNFVIQVEVLIPPEWGEGARQILSNETTSESEFKIGFDDRRLGV
jgi:hypothetical protein